MTRAATPAIAALIAARAPQQVLQYRHDPRQDAFGKEAVDALAELGGSEAAAPEQVFKTLVLALPQGLAVAVLPVPSTLSLKAAATADLRAT